MKSYKFFAAILLMLAMTMAVNVTAKEKRAPKMYVFGISTSFNDSTAYFTNIQEIDSVTTIGKTKILSNKQEYSYQLRNYFSAKGLPNRTCVTINGKKRKKVEKSYAKLKLKYTKKFKYILKDLNENEFKYERVVMAQ